MIVLSRFGKSHSIRGRKAMTLLHISDLHIGSISNPGKNLNAPTPRSVRLAKIFQGKLGHHHRALQRLQELHDRLVAKEKDVRVVMTGDATSFGRVDEFANADDFLGASLHGVGLRCKPWARRAISGNHDQWPGNGNICGPATASLQMHFPPRNFPDLGTVEPLVGQYKVRFIRIDTDADIRPRSVGRLLAWGAFASQLATLEKHLPLREENELRVLLLHHAPRFDHPRHLAPLSIRRNSSRLLEKICVEYGISVLMCGHTHAPAHVTPFTASAASGVAIEAFEVCCGTTTQRDRLPVGVRTLTGQVPTWPMEPNTLFVHRFEEPSRNGLELVSQRYTLTSFGFTPTGSPLRNRVIP
jgi:hypothetical protein